MRYLHVQAEPIMRNFSKVMISHVGDTDPAFEGVLPHLAGVVHDNDDDDIGPDDDNIGTNPPDNIGIEPKDPTPIEQEDPRELQDEQPLATNNEPTDVNSITSTNDTTIDNPIKILPTGVYKFYNLTTGKLITRRNWTALPMPMEVIARVNRIGQAQGQPSVITFQSCL